MDNGRDFQHLERMARVLGWNRVENANESTLRFTLGENPDNWVDLPYSMGSIAMVETLTRAYTQIHNLETGF